MFKALYVMAFIAATPLVAEINPRYYVEMQKKSPERLRLRIEKVDSDACDKCETYKTRVSATVTKVIRTKASLKKGKKVFFEYEVFEPREGWVGPRPMPVLTAGEEYDFFGSKTGVDAKKRVLLAPGARGYSFDSLIGRD